jgi:hypothetical protein
MTTMLKRLLLAFVLSLSASSAFAVCSAIPLPIADFAGTSRSMSTATAADGNCKTYIDADTSSQLHADITAATPAGTNLIGYTSSDPCNNASTKVYTAINMVTATNTVIAGVSAKKKYICSIFLYPSAADNVAIYQATTGTACATAQVAILGGTTTATGFVMTAQAGFVVGNGVSSVAATTVVNTDICITTSAAVQLSGAVVTADQ